MHASIREKYAKQLQGPPVPESLAYLREWQRMVHAQSGYTMDGPIPATIDVIQKVLSALGIEPPPTEDELMAVRQLDIAYIVASRPARDAPKATPPEAPSGHRRR